MIVITVCYSIKQRSKLLLFCCCKKKQELQCNGLTSKNSNSFLIVFIVWRQFICFVFARQILMFLPFSLSFRWLKKKCTFHGNIYTNEKLNPFSNKICNFYVKRRRIKLFFNCLQEAVSYTHLTLPTNREV